MARMQREPHVGDRFAHGRRLVAQHVEVHRLGQLFLKGGEERAHPVHHLDGVGAGLLLDGEHDGAGSPAVLVVPARHPPVLHAVDHLREFAHPHGRPVAIGDDNLAEFVHIGQLAGGHHHQGLVRPVEQAGRQVDVVRVERRLHVAERDAAAGQQVRVEPHAQGVFLRAVNLHLRHAVHHGDALREHRLGVFVHGRQRQGGRTQREEEHGLVGRVRLAEGGRRRHLVRQAALHGGDGGLHVLRRAHRCCARA